MECAGIYHCPNPLCKSAGAAWFRARLKSYKPTDEGHHTVDAQEVLNVGLAMLPDLDRAVQQAAINMVEYWVDRACTEILNEDHPPC